MSSRNGVVRIQILLMLIVFLIACSPSTEQRANQTATKKTDIAASWTGTPTITVTATATQTVTTMPLPLPRPEIIDPSWEIIHFDAFDQKSSAFPEREVGDCTISIRDGKSVWKFLSNSSNGLGLNASNIPDLSDFYVSVEGNQIVCPGNCSYGLKLRSGSKLGYYFSIFEKKQRFNFQLVDFSGSGESFNVETFASSINPDGPNVLAVLAEGSEITLFINDVVVTQIQDDTSLSGKVGFIITSSIASSEAEFEFDNFQVYGN